jgi:hypothetical protein
MVLLYCTLVYLVNGTIVVPMFSLIHAPNHCNVQPGLLYKKEVFSQLLCLYRGHVRDHCYHRLDDLGIDKLESQVPLMFTRPQRVVRCLKQPRLWCRVQGYERERCLAPFMDPKYEELDLTQSHLIVQKYLYVFQIRQKGMK